MVILRIMGWNTPVGRVPDSPAESGNRPLRQVAGNPKRREVDAPRGNVDVAGRDIVHGKLGGAEFAEVFTTENNMEGGALRNDRDDSVAGPV